MRQIGSLLPMSLCETSIGFAKTVPAAAAAVLDVREKSIAVSKTHVKPMLFRLEGIGLFFVCTVGKDVL